jgi:hypothetical protein
LLPQLLLLLLRLSVLQKTVQLLMVRQQQSEPAAVMALMMCRCLSSVHAWLQQHCWLRRSSCKANRPQLLPSSPTASNSSLQRKQSRLRNSWLHKRLQPSSLQQLHLPATLVQRVWVLLRQHAQALVVQASHHLVPGHTAHSHRLQQGQAQ